MLKSNRQNFHRSKLPPLGTVGYIVGLDTVNPRRKCIVVAYSLSDTADYHHSIGIHTVLVRFLDDSSIARFSGCWFQPQV